MDPDWDVWYWGPSWDFLDWDDLVLGSWLGHLVLRPLLGFPELDWNDPVFGPWLGHLVLRSFLVYARLD